MQPSSPMHTGQTSQAQRIISGLARLWHGCRHQGYHALHRAESRASMLRQRPLIGVLIGLLGGSLLGAHLPLSPQLIGALLAVTGLVLYPWPYTQLQRGCRLLLAGLLLTHGSMAWHHRALPLNHIAYALPASTRQHLTVEGRVERPVESYHDRQRLYLRLHRLQDTQGWRVVSGRARLSIHATELSFLPGDTVRVTRLRLHRVRGFRNPGGFDFQRFMQRQDIYVIGGVSDPKRLSLRHRPQGWSLARRLERWRRNLRALVRAHLPTPYDAVLLAMILGQRGALPADLQDHFRATGTAHLLVVSGLHVGFLTAALLFGLRAFLRLVRSWIPRTWLPAWRPTPLAVLLCLPSVLLYCSLVGWKVSTVRAVLMVGSYLLALILSRPRDLMHALCLAAALILLLQPRTLFGLGFQLSFVAVSALILVGQRHWWHDEAPNLIRRWRRRLWASTLGSSAAYLGTLPIIVGAFHTIPTYGILANLLLLPLASVIVPAGAVALGLTTAWPVLGSTVFTPLLPLLSWITTLVRFIAGLPGAQLHVAALSTPALVGYYGLCLGLVVPWRARWRLACAGLGAVLLLGGIGWHYVATRPRQLRVTFLDVGTGDAILVQVPGRHY
ncbi:MAG: ComEC/Rec2 family competence protein, partial [Candidatus Tectomicrobia bacterium]